MKDNTLFSRIAAFIGSRSTLSEEGKLEALTRLTMDEDLSKEIIEASYMRYYSSFVFIFSVNYL